MPLLLADRRRAGLAVRAELTRLQAAEFLYETRLFPDLEYTFKHALTHEVAYGRGCSTNGSALCTPASPRPSSGSRPSASPSRSSGLLTTPCAASCGRRRSRIYARRGFRPWRGPPTARPVAHLEQALGALRRLPETRETTELTIDIRLDVRHALLPLGERARMGDHPPRGGGARQDVRRSAPARADRHFHGRIIARSPATTPRPSDSDRRP